MKKRLLFLLVGLFFFSGFSLNAQQGTGEEIFKSVCAACHTIGKGRLVGPDLSNIYNIRKNDWLIKFVRSSQTFIKSGDTAAINIFNEFNKIPMPDNRLADAQILSVIEYVRQSTGALQTAALKPVVSTDTLHKQGAGISTDSTAVLYSVDNVPAGKNLFYGYKRFASGIPPCAACHYISDQSVMGGGRLALDLTGAYRKLGPAGISSIMLNPPFPVMKTAMADRVPDKKEIREVISLLKSLSDEKYSYNIPGSAGIFFASMAFVLALIIIAHLYIYYDSRKIP